MENLKLFGKRIKELRKMKKLTQEQLGEMVGVDYKQIGNIETGTYFTTMTTLEKIAKALNVEIVELFNFNHNQDKDDIMKEIIELLSRAPEDKLKTTYRAVRAILK